MVGIVGHGVLRALVPIGEGLHQRLIAVGNAKIDDHRGAAGQRGLCAALVIVCRIRAHERHVEMGVRVDAARHDEAARRVERAVALQAIADRLDGFAFHQHVGLVGAVRGDDRSAFDDERHVPSLLIHRTLAPLFGTRAGVRGPAQGVERRPALDGLCGEKGSRHDTISAFSKTACISTLAPAVDHSFLMSSLSLWLTPSTQGVNTIEVGATRAR